MKIYWAFVLTVFLSTSAFCAEITWIIPQGKTLVASPVRGGISQIFQDQILKIDSLWHISKTSPRWQFFSSSQQAMQNNTRPIVTELLANSGYIVDASLSIQIVTEPASIPAVTPLTGFQLIPLVAWDSNPLSIAGVANNLAALGPLHSIFTIEAGQWLAYFHNPNLATQNIRNPLNSVGNLQEVTAGRAYFVSFSPTAGVVTFRNHKSEHNILNQPQILIGNVPGYISKIGNNQATIVPLHSNQPFTFTTWPDAVKLRLIESHTSFDSKSEFEFRMTDQTAPATHYASATANQFQSTINPNGETNTTMALNAAISGAVFTNTSPNQINKTNEGLDSSDGHQNTFPQFGFAVQNYIQRIQEVASEHIKGFENIPLTLKFATPQTKFSVMGSSATFTRLCLVSFS
ncbi:MAG: hypothetical protein H3C47_16500 [Candidatus Cloacimonetes bacterium]|nr:hypothetical protein [Candidatus Cloacimonadota bacterium]